MNKEMPKACIHTFGCQMNEHDSLRLKQMVISEGYQLTEDLEQAQLILINTCSVREKPENKLYSLLGRLSILKKKNPETIIAVGGCVAQQEGENIMKREKMVDLVFGTDCLFKLPELLARVKMGERVVSTEWLPREKKIQNFIPEPDLKTGSIEGCKGLLAITKGCDNYCTYCIVPTTRGRLVSRQLENILAEARELIKKGVKEIQLIGQNVNSYQDNENSFLDLLRSISALKGLTRLRFTSPHPNDWNNQLSDLMAESQVICKQIHLPLQSGSDRILALMKRDHGAKEYLEKVDYLRKKIPFIDISTDIIVGFPGESDEDFEQTLTLLRKVKFSQIYAFKYSPRPGTKAEALEDDVPKEIKENRLERLLKIQETIQIEILTRLIGSIQTVLIDNPHPKESKAMIGRSDGNIPVVIPDSKAEVGDLLTVEIISKRQHSLVGKEVIPRDEELIH